MLPSYRLPEITPEDRILFDTLVPFDHWVRRAVQFIDFIALRKIVESSYSSGREGAPGIEPVLLIKLELLLFHENLSDGQLWSKVKTDLAYRFFLGLGRHDHLPDRTTLNKFRARLGSEGHKKLFHGLLEQARGHGLVRDRLRIKDATHVLADIAIPAGLTLVAQARNRLLAALQTFAPDYVAGEKVQIEAIRTRTDSLSVDTRLLARIEHLRDILLHSDEVPTENQVHNDRWELLVKAREIARKTLAGHDHPKEGDKLRSVVDPDARRGRHGEFYDGYMLDVTIDADSELFTAVNTLAASGNESIDTLELVDQEQSAHGNQIEKISIDGAGFDGPMLRQLEDPQGRNIEAFVPPRAPNHEKFGPEQFELSEDESQVTCPAGKPSQYRQRDNAREATIFRFNKSDCESCALAGKCVSKSTKFGRSVNKSDYVAEHTRVRERAKTPEYQSIKSEHPKVERKLGHAMNRFGGRHARYRGLDRVKSQGLMSTMAANLHRMLVLLAPFGEVENAHSVMN